MAEPLENKIQVIQQQDPNLPPFLDFELLREEGLKHLGDLSGKIWTDHNVHDPGITILEVLIYALLDLGYRTNLPFEDLITVQDQQTKDDNFLSPLQILTVNPVTITDYRKLLLEVEGVRNAWLEPAREEVPFYIDSNTNTLSCDAQHPFLREKCPGAYDGSDRENPYGQIHLNGLYNVCIEKDPNLTDDLKLEGEVRAWLSAHRNLCEDFVNINILRPIDFGVCAEVELQEGAKVDIVYVDIIKKLKTFIQPEIKYYTLNELLDQGKAIDDIFAGRPYSNESYGFLDTGELESMELRSEFHLSDLYSLILGVEGVRKVRKVRIGECRRTNGSVPDWIGTTEIPQGSAPVFSLADSCVDLYDEGRVLRLDKARIHRTFSYAKKFLLPGENLDTQVPSGVYRPDLGDFPSIQNDFPVVYGIGDDGLPDSATLLRKTQALQLKAYLMFYDQVLANYAATLANIRALFSLKPEKERNAEEKRTCFTEMASGIPQMDKLLGFQDTNGNKGARLAVPIFDDTAWKTALEKLQNNSKTVLSIGDYCTNGKSLAQMARFDSSAVRAIHIGQLIDSFYNASYSVGILQDANGYFFTLCPDLPNEVLLIGTKRCRSEGEAREQAKSVAFLASLQESYVLVSDPSDSVAADRHFFELAYHPISYINLIQELTENGAGYMARRKQFLDHLLARFGEEFTDHTLFQYQNKISRPGLNQETLNDQSSYVNEFAEISRNRGRAFDYLKPSWNTDNVSGFEKRVSLLSGINDYNRRNLCNFEVTACFRLQLNGPQGDVLFRSNRSYETLAELERAANKLLEDLRDPSAYKSLAKNLNGFDAAKTGGIFSIEPSEKNIVVFKYDYYQQLVNFEGNAVGDGKKMRSEKTAADKKDEFIKAINEKNPQGKKDKKYRLLPLAQKNRYLDTNGLDHEIKTVIIYKWHINDEDPKKNKKSETVFEKQEKAWADLIQNIRIKDYITEHDTAQRWKLIIKGNIFFSAANWYGDKNKAVASWRQAKMLGSSAKNFTLAQDGKSILLKNEKGGTVARSNTISPDAYDPETLIDDCTTVLGNRNTKPTYEKETGKFGFKITGKEDWPLLQSYCVYDSEIEALRKMGKAFKNGADKKNYLLSGDQGNLEYNFILKDTEDSFLALPSDNFETARERDRALKGATGFFEKNDVPVDVKEEPRKYIWSLFEAEKTVLESDAEFASKAKAQADFDKKVCEAALKNNSRLFAPQLYEFAIKAAPALYKFVYGVNTSQTRPDNLFISNEAFSDTGKAEEAFSDFAKMLPGLDLKTFRKKGRKYDYAFYGSDKKNPLAVQHRSGGQKASLESAKELIDYMTQVYTKNGTPRQSYVTSAMAENREGRYEWRFYKKNAPLAKSPYLCPDKESAQRIKILICDVTPPVSLKDCPPKKKTVCPAKDPKQHHYQVCFSDKQGHEFRLISYAGFDSQSEAEKAWDREWLEIIDLARDETNYGENGKISVKETYTDPRANACAETSFKVVVPEEISKEFRGDEEAIIKHLVGLAHLYPLYKIDDKADRKCHEKYKYRVVVPEIVLGTDCTFQGPEKYKGRLLWESVECFGTISDAIAAYLRFYTLAGTANNCRVLCEKGWFFVGLVEVLAESGCEYRNEAEAWDDAFPNEENKDECGNCVTGGVREFVYATEDDKNYIVDCEQNWWKFKVVSPSYFVAEHVCCYNSEIERNERMDEWKERLLKINWEAYFTDQGCKAWDKEEEPSNYFPIHKTDEGFCYRLYWPEKDENEAENDLQPCGCGEEEEETGTACKETYPFISSNCYDCCEEALQAFERFTGLISEGLFTLEPIKKSDHGPYSFQIIDRRKELAHHPQQYECLQDVLDAIVITKNCVNNTGMHLLEHILLRPKTKSECEFPVVVGDNEFERKSCLLPICPDYCCPIPWQPDLEKDDPCAVCPESETIHYLPGSDPYSFWATLVLPAWAKRFRTQEARQTFEKFLYKEVPALVGLNILWLSPRAMCKFEDGFRRWLDWLQEQDPDKKKLCPPADVLPHCIVADCIKELQSEDPCLTDPEAQGDCDCGCNEPPEYNECCLPPDTKGTIFWGQCPPTSDQDLPPNDDVVLISAASEADTEKEKKVVPKKKNKKTSDKAILALVRKRKPKYVANIKNSSDEKMQSTKSYERALFFLQNTPTIDGYVQLVHFFDRYSLQKGNDIEGFLELLQNATHHLFDALALDKNASVDREAMDTLKKSIQILKENGMSPKNLETEWKSEEIRPLANAKTLGDLKKILK